MAEQTTDVRGLATDVPTENLRAALDMVDPHTKEVVRKGDVLVWGDGCADPDVFVMNLAEKEVSDLINVDRIEIESSFTEFVKDEFHVDVLDDRAFADGGQIDVTTTQGRDTFGRTVGQNLDQSDDVEIQYITFGENGGEVFGKPEEDRELRIGLKDTRE
jgi:hypothetical protein